MNARIEIIPVLGLPEIQPGAKIADLIFDSIVAGGEILRDRDVLVVCQKIVSKSEERFVRIGEIIPSKRAEEIGAEIGKDPRKVEIILRESSEIVRAARVPGKPEGIIIARHKLGFICANAGIDESNSGGDGVYILLPENPDSSASAIRDAAHRRFGSTIGVIITDTFGRAWRLGLTNVAIGSAGVKVLDDLRGESDSEGRKLSATVLAVCDEVAAAAGLAMGKLNRVPAAIVRGLDISSEAGRISDMIRPTQEDLFL